MEHSFRTQAAFGSDREKREIRFATPREAMRMREDAERKYEVEEEAKLRRMAASDTVDLIDREDAAANQKAQQRERLRTARVNFLDEGGILEGPYPGAKGKAKRLEMQYQALNPRMSIEFREEGDVFRLKGDRKFVAWARAAVARQISLLGKGKAGRRLGTKPRERWENDDQYRERMDALRRDLDARRSVPEEDLEAIEEWQIVLNSLEERQSETKTVDDLAKEQRSAKPEELPAILRKWEANDRQLITENPDLYLKQLREAVRVNYMVLEGLEERNVLTADQIVAIVHEFCGVSPGVVTFYPESLRGTKEYEDAMNKAANVHGAVLAIANRDYDQHWKEKQPKYEALATTALHRTPSMVHAGIRGLDTPEQYTGFFRTGAPAAGPLTKGTTVSTTVTVTVITPRIAPVAPTAVTRDKFTPAERIAMLASSDGGSFTIPGGGGRIERSLETFKLYVGKDGLTGYGGFLSDIIADVGDNKEMQLACIRATLLNPAIAPQLEHAHQALVDQMRAWLPALMDHPSAVEVVVPLLSDAQIVAMLTAGEHLDAMQYFHRQMWFNPQIRKLAIGHMKKNADLVRHAPPELLADVMFALEILFKQPAAFKHFSGEVRCNPLVIFAASADPEFNWSNLPPSALAIGGKTEIINRIDFSPELLKLFGSKEADTFIIRLLKEPELSPKIAEVLFFLRPNLLTADVVKANPELGTMKYLQLAAIANPEVLHRADEILLAPVGPVKKQTLKPLKDALQNPAGTMMTPEAYATPANEGLRAVNESYLEEMFKKVADSDPKQHEAFFYKKNDDGTTSQWLQDSVVRLASNPALANDPLRALQLVEADARLFDSLPSKLRDAKNPDRPEFLRAAVTKNADVLLRLPGGVVPAERHALAVLAVTQKPELLADSAVQSVLKDEIQDPVKGPKLIGENIKMLPHIAKCFNLDDLKELGLYIQIAVAVLDQHPDRVSDLDEKVLKDIRFYRECDKRDTTRYLLSFLSDEKMALQLVVEKHDRFNSLSDTLKKVEKISNVAGVRAEQERNAAELRRLADADKRVEEKLAFAEAAPEGTNAKLTELREKMAHTLAFVLPRLPQTVKSPPKDKDSLIDIDRVKKHMDALQKKYAAAGKPGDLPSPEKIQADINTLEDIRVYAEKTSVLIPDKETPRWAMRTELAAPYLTDAEIPVIALVQEKRDGKVENPPVQETSDLLALRVNMKELVKRMKIYETEDWEKWLEMKVNPKDKTSIKNKEAIDNHEAKISALLDGAFKLLETTKNDAPVRRWILQALGSLKAIPQSSIDRIRDKNLRKQWMLAVAKAESIE